MSFDLTEAELLEAIREAATHNTADDPPGAFRVVEVAESLGWSVKRVQAALHRIQHAGRLQRTRVWRTDLAGRRVPVAAYRILE
jgi:MarR-like DNA-binding transcriptional regulator SgrR of sgrS sRNA